MPTDWEIVNAMGTHGGSFARALAVACHHADPENLAKIKAAWPELWDEYRQLAALHKAKADASAR